MSSSLGPWELQHAGLLCPSLSPGVCSNSCSLSWWCHPDISSSVIPFSSCLQSFPASEFFPMSRGSSHQVAKVLEFQLQQRSFQWIFRVDFLKIDWFDLLVVQGTLKSFLQHHSSKASVHQCSVVFMVQLSHPHMTTGKTIASTIQTFVSKTVSLFFNILSRFVVFLPRNKCLNFMAAVTICEYRSLHFFLSCISNVYCELGRIGTLPLGENSLSIPQLELFPYEHALPCPL